jgi:hypothetical protein
MVQPSEAFQVIWIGWVVSWVAASLWSGRTEKRAATRETWIYRIVIFAGAILIAPWTAQVLGEKPDLANWRSRRLCTRRLHAARSRANLVGANATWPPLVQRDHAQGRTSAS